MPGEDGRRMGHLQPKSAGTLYGQLTCALGAGDVGPGAGEPGCLSRVSEPQPTKSAIATNTKRRARSVRLRAKFSMRYD